MTGPFKFQVLRGPHLVFAYVGGEIGVVAGGFSHSFNDGLRLNRAGLLSFIGKAFFAAPKSDVFHPLSGGGGIGAIARFL